MPRLFVYGSLLRGEPNHDVLEGASFLGDAKTAAGVGLVAAGPYPSVVFATTAPAVGSARDLEHAQVMGELYEVDEDHLAALDHFEGHPHMFARERVTLDDGTTAFVYALAPSVTSGRAILPSGDWRQRSDEKKRGPNPMGA